MYSNPTEWTTKLTSLDHVKLSLELVGDAFALQLDDIITLERAFSLYRQWLLPEPIFGIDLGVQMLIHMTMVCQAKRVPEGKAQSIASLVNRHIELIKSVLGLIEEVTRTYLFDSQHRKVIARLVIGMSDSLLKEQSSTFSTLTVKEERQLYEQPGYLANELVEQLALSSINIILNSAIYSEPVWSLLERCFPRWLQNRIQVTLLWSVLGVALTERVAQILYQTRGSSKTDTLNIPWQVQPVCFVSLYFTLNIGHHHGSLCHFCLGKSLQVAPPLLPL